MPIRANAHSRSQSRDAAPSRQWSPARRVSEPDDAIETEAARVAADALGPAASGRPDFSISRIPVGPVLRDGDDKKTNDEKYADAAKKAGEAFMETDVGKKIKEKVTDDPLVKDAKEAGEAFIGTLPGKVITGAAAAGVIAALAATHRELPLQIPEIPLDRWAPGLSVKLTYEGPVDNPTRAMVTFTFREGAGKKAKGKSESDRYRDETARIKAEQDAFTARQRYAPGSAADVQQRAEEDATRRAIQSRIGRLPSEGASTTPALGTPTPSPGLQLSTAPLTFKARPLRILDQDLQLKPESDATATPAPKKKDDDKGGVMREARGTGAARGASGVPPIVDDVLASPGQALESGVRGMMEGRLGHDFSRVRIHTGPVAARSAEAVNSHAFTVGDHVVFSDPYRPDTRSGVRLLAHELAHVIQQGSVTPRSGQGLAIERGASDPDRSADRAAERVARGHPASVERLAPRGAGGRLQRAEHGTYVSTHDANGKEYLDAAVKFYQNWGHPNVRRAANMGDVLNDLDTAKGPIERFRIVSHGSPGAIELGLLPEMAPNLFNQVTAKFTEQKPFREMFTDKHLVAEDVFAKIYAALQKDAATTAFVTTLGGGTTVPDMNTSLGIVLRAIVETEYVRTVQLDTGGPAPIAHRDVLNTFNSMRLATYGNQLVTATATTANQPAMRAAMAGIARALPAVMTSASLSFGTLTKQEAADLADPFINASAAPNRLSPLVTKSITEGAGGPYLKTLRSVQAKVTKDTHIEIRGCNVGKNSSMLDSFRSYFGGPTMAPSISAPDLYQYYFQLGVQTYGNAPSEETRLQQGFADPTTGIAQSFEDLQRTKAGEMTRVVEETKLSELAAKYGFVEADVRKLNPEIGDPNKLKPGDVIWLVQRTEVAAGRYGTLENFCRDYLGDIHAWPKVWAANPQIHDPSALDPSDRIQVPQSVLKVRAPGGPPTVASPVPTAADFSRTVRGGTAVAAMNTGTNKPVLHADDRKRAAEIGGWLAAQRWDPNGRTAAVLGRGFGGDDKAFTKARKGTYIEFLSRGYPNIVDAIFPEDPRYDKHIIRRP